VEVTVPHKLAEVDRRLRIGRRARDPAALVDPIVIGAALHLDLAPGEQINDILDAERGLRPAVAQIVEGVPKPLGMTSSPEKIPYKSVD
jgi:hypothetical protein